MFWKKWFEPKPFNEGFLPEKEGHKVFFAEFGNPEGVPILCFHGGPGGGSRPQQARFADLKRFRVILFDQRGCGRSLPAGELKNNTTQDLLKDAERLLDYLKIKEKVILRGASWGAALALLFAEKHARKICGLLLSQVFLADKAAQEWEIEGNRNFYPDFVAEMESKARGNIRSFYEAEINSKSVKRQLNAANHYGFFERICGSLTPAWGVCSELSEKELASQRVFLHYAAQNFMLGEREIMDNIEKIKQIPAVIVHNRLDFVCPPKGAYDVHRVLLKSKLVIVPEKGHVGRLLAKAIRTEFAAWLRNM